MAQLYAFNIKLYFNKTGHKLSPYVLTIIKHPPHSEQLGKVSNLILLLLASSTVISFMDIKCVKPHSRQRHSFSSSAQTFLSIFIFSYFCQIMFWCKLHPLRKFIPVQFLKVLRKRMNNTFFYSFLSFGPECNAVKWKHRGEGFVFIFF